MPQPAAAPIAINQTTTQMQQQQYQQQQQQQQNPSFAQTQPNPPVGSDLSSIQYAQLQQLQFQQMQWQYLQQLQQQQLYLQQQQQQQQQGVDGTGADFDPNGTSSHAAGGSKQYRSAYQSYGQYPTSSQSNQQQQQLATLDENGQMIEQQQQDGIVNEQSGENVVDGMTTTRSRYHNDQHPPSIDPDAWNSSLAYPSKSNPDRYLTHRNYFSNIPPVVNRLPRKPELKDLVLRGRDFYTNNRDPRFYNPVQESGWDNRAHVVKVPITAGGPTSHISGLNSFRSSEPSPQQQQQAPTVEESKEAFGHFPVLIDNGSASTRPGSKLLVPFLHCWPPPFRFDFLKKHSRAPLSPFLASQNGYEVPPELYMSTKQRQEQERRNELQQREMNGYGYGSSTDQYQDLNQPQRPSPHSSDPIERARARANIHTTYWRTVPSDANVDDNASVVRAGAHSNRSLSDRGGGPSSSSLSGGVSGGGQSQQPSSTKTTMTRPEWNYRHHLKPPQPRVGQTTAKKVVGRREKAQERLQQQQQQQQQQQYQQQQFGAYPPGFLPPIPGAHPPPPPSLVMPVGGPPPPPFFFMPQQFGAPDSQGGVPYVDPQQFQRQLEFQQYQFEQLEPQQQQQFIQQQYEGQQYFFQQQQQMQLQQQQQQQPPSSSSSPSDPSAAAFSSHTPSSTAPIGESQAVQPAEPSSNADGTDSTDAAAASSQAPAPAADSTSTAPVLNPNAGAHVKDVYGQLYQQSSSTAESEAGVGVGVGVATVAEETPVDTNESQEATATADQA